MRAKRTSRAFMTSLVLHLAIAFIVSLYLVSQTRQFKDLVGVDVLKFSKPPKPTVRKPIVILHVVGTCAFSKIWKFSVSNVSNSDL